MRRDAACGREQVLYWNWPTRNPPSLGFEPRGGPRGPSSSLGYLSLCYRRLRKKNSFYVGLLSVSPGPVLGNRSLTFPIVRGALQQCSSHHYVLSARRFRTADVCEKPFLLPEPWPYDITGATALQPQIRCSESLSSRGSSSPEECCLVYE